MTRFFVNSFESRINPKFLAESERNAVKAKSNRVREGNGRRFQAHTHNNNNNNK